MISESQKQRAQMFLNMHRQNRMFILPNAWNAGSAYVFEQQGFKAAATSSAGVAYDLGCPDGEDIAFDELMYVVKKITGRVDIPLSVDIERGHGFI